MLLSETLEVVLVFFLQKSGVCWVALYHRVGERDPALLEHILLLSSNDHLVQISLAHYETDELKRPFHVVFIVSQTWLVELDRVENLFLVDFVVIDVCVHALSSIFTVARKAGLARHNRSSSVFFGCRHEWLLVELWDMSTNKQRVLRCDLVGSGT